MRPHNHRKFLWLSNIIFVLTGLGLLLAPRSWFPDFYHPIYFGIVFLLSPILITLPNLFLKESSPQKKNLVLKMRTVIALALIINMGGELGLFQLFRYGFEYDKFAHFLVCMLFAIMLGESLEAWEHFSYTKIAFTIILIGVMAGLVWEGLEAASDALFHTSEWGMNGYGIKVDTFRDIIFNTLGLFSGLIVLRLPRKKKFVLFEE